MTLLTFLANSLCVREYYYFNNTHLITHNRAILLAAKCVTFSLSSVGRKLTWVLYDRVPFVCREPPKEIPFLKPRPISPMRIIYTQISEKPFAIHLKYISTKINSIVSSAEEFCRRKRLCGYGNPMEIGQNLADHDRIGKLGFRHYHEGHSSP